MRRNIDNETVIKTIVHKRGYGACTYLVVKLPDGKFDYSEACIPTGSDYQRDVRPLASEVAKQCIGKTIAEIKETMKDSVSVMWSHWYGVKFNENGDVVSAHFPNYTD